MTKINKRIFPLNKNILLFSGLVLASVGIPLLVFQKVMPLFSHITYYCQSFINSNMVQIPNFLSLIPLLLLFLIIAIATIKISIIYFRIHALRHKLKGRITTNTTINKLIEKIGLKNKVLVVKSNKRYAFCLGVRNPNIYISTGLISQISLKEVEVVLRHEQYHLERHDTATQVIASVAHSLFFFFPLVGDLVKRYQIEREIEADRFAASYAGTKNTLVSALKKLLAFPSIEPVFAANISDQDTLEPRIYSLMNQSYTKKYFKAKHLLITVFSTLVLVFIVGIPVHAQEIHHENHDVIMVCTDGECMNSCISEQNLSKLYSEIPTSSKSETENFSHPYTSAHSLIP